VNADDRYRPGALDGIDAWAEDVMVMGNAFLGQTWLGMPDRREIARVRFNCVPCGSPVRLDAYRRSPGFVDMMPFSDWALWVGLARTGATFARTGRIDYDYRWHADSFDPAVAEPTRLRILAWAASL